MKRFFVKIYDYFSSHRFVLQTAMLLLLIVEVLLGLRIGFKENVTDFLPQDEESSRYMSVYDNMSGQNSITVLFRPMTEDAELGHFAILEAVERFNTVCDSLADLSKENIGLRCYVDEELAVEAMGYMRDNIGLFLNDEDYKRIDSLLASPGYLDTCLLNVKKMLAFPMGNMAQQAILSDPLGMFRPVYQRLENLSPSEQFEIDEGVLFDGSGIGFAFVDSPYGGNDTKGNGRVVNILEDAIQIVLSSCDSVDISAIGAPVIAVSNAKQIKKDSLFAMLLSIVLIALILVVALRSVRNIALLGLSVMAGWLFALAAVSIFSPTVSIIVIGIGSILLGIAVNYPLHFLEHLQKYPDRRETLKEMVEPLVTGNITTVSAFACLMFVDSSAMQDLGLFGSTMLIGTILFVMIFLPQIGKREVGVREESERSQRGVREELERSQRGIMRKWGTGNGGCVRKGIWLLPLAVLTIWLGIRSTNPSFDDNLHNINYITSTQSADLDLLNNTLEDGSFAIEYIVTEHATLDDALRAQEDFFASYRHVSNRSDVKPKGPSGILPSKAYQDTSLVLWNEHKDQFAWVVSQVRQKSLKYGFSSTAFQSFTDALGKDYDIIEPTEMTPLLGLADAYLSGFNDESDSGMIVSMLSVPESDSERYKSQLRESVSEVSGSTGMFVFDINDLGSSLVRSLNFDFNYILYVCGFVVFFFLWLSFGRLELALLSFLPLAVAWIWILGIMDIASVKFNIVNIILATFIFGQGDDYTIFITEGLIYENAYGRKRLKSYSRSVIVSALLMFVGIGSLIFAKHPAMRSLAEVAIIGMAVVVVMACYLPPIIYRWLTQRKGLYRRVPVTLMRLFNTFVILLVFFVAAFVIVTPYTFLYRLIGRDSDAKRLRFHRMIQRFTGRAVRLLPGVGFNVENPSQEQFDKPMVIIANHQSHLDLLCMLQLSPKLVILTTDWVWRNPIYGAIIRYAEFFPVHDGFEALAPKLKTLTERGYSVVVFPEGTRSLTGEIGRFHKGAFQLAQQLGVDILPVFLHGGNHVMPKDDILLRRGQLTVEIGERIKPESLMGETRQIAKRMHDYYVVHFAEMRYRIEDESYCLPFVRYQYLYKGREVARKCRQNVDTYLKKGVERTGQGEVAILKALAHTDRHFSYMFDNEDDYLIARNIVERLHITNLELCLKC